MKQAQQQEAEERKDEDAAHHETKQEEQQSISAVPLFSIQSKHVPLPLSEAIFTAQNKSSTEQLAQLFHLNDQHHHRPYVTMVAPMVCYSKLPFRLLCRQWGADIAYTPMIIAKGFNVSAAAREADFNTNDEDQPLIIQFGVHDPIDLALATERVIGSVQGIDINCGCPQRWAIQEGIGAALIDRPQRITEMVKAAHAICQLPISIKIRIKTDLRHTIDLITQAEHAGVSFITVHGRTVKERKQPVNVDAIKLIKSVASVPIIANGDLFNTQKITDIQQETQVDGVMSARGILANPALFSQQHSVVGQVPNRLYGDYMRLAYAYGGRYSIHHHHLMFMLHHALSRAERQEFMSIKTLAGCQAFMEERGFV